MYQNQFLVNPKSEWEDRRQLLIQAYNQELKQQYLKKIQAEEERKSIRKKSIIQTTYFNTPSNPNSPMMQKSNPIHYYSPQLEKTKIFSSSPSKENNIFQEDSSRSSFP